MLNSEKFLKTIVFLSGFLLFFTVFCFICTLFLKALPSISLLGLSFYTTTHWNPVQHQFGMLPFLAGTLITSLLALLIATPFALASALFLGEYVTQGAWHQIMKGLIDISAGIPSVLYGFWGLFFVVPFVRKIQIMFHCVPYGVGLLSASIILAMMIIPFCSSLSREILSSIPKEYKEVAISLGATRFEMIRKVLLPYAKSGLITGLMLSMGRALGETMAVALVIGNSNLFPSSLFSPSNTIASLIANEFAEVSDPIYLSVLIQLALVLFLITTMINIFGKKWIYQFTIKDLH